MSPSTAVSRTRLGCIGRLQLAKSLRRTLREIADQDLGKLRRNHSTRISALTEVSNRVCFEHVAGPTSRSCVASGSGSVSSNQERRQDCFLLFISRGFTNSDTVWHNLSGCRIFAKLETNRESQWEEFESGISFDRPARRTRS